LIVAAATSLIEDHGLEGLSAREIARKINYSPGTLYNVFQDRDEIILTIEERLLDGLDAHLANVEYSDGSHDYIVRLAQAYLQFTHENPKLWTLLFEHKLTNGKTAPTWYQEKISRLMARLENAIAEAMPQKSKKDVQRSARVVWAGVHGISSLSTTDKLSHFTNEAANDLVGDLVGTYLTGFGDQAEKPKKATSRRRR
jgi:AcrR family transcriptional regulator